MDKCTKLIREIKKCTECKQHLPLGPNPVVSFNSRSRIMVIGQAPGTKVHASGTPWDDASGKRLREWMGVSDDQFYSPNIFGIVPMGFCYPGKGKSGDLPPRKECAPLWHGLIFESVESVDLILLIGSYAQKYYLKEKMGKTLTETVKKFDEYLPLFFPLPHPSPRNNIWIRKNPWFEKQVLPRLKERIRMIIGKSS